MSTNWRKCADDFAELLHGGVREVIFRAIDDNHLGTTHAKMAARARIDRYITSVIQSTTYDEFDSLCHEFLHEMTRHRYPVKDPSCRDYKSAIKGVRCIWRAGCNDDCHY